MNRRRYVRANSGITFRPGNNTQLWLPGQDDPFSSTIRDRSGNGNNGTLSGGASWVRDGNGIWYLNFAGDGQIVTIGQDSSINDLEDATYLMWVKTNSPGDFDRFFDKSGAGASPQVQFSWKTGGFLGWFRDYSGDNVDFITNNRSIVDSVFTHVALTTISKRADIFVNGIECTYSSEQVGTGTLDTDAGNDLSLGARVFGSVTSEYTGGIALFDIEAPSMTAGQILNRYNQERGLFGV